jgi:hypothetical protein
MHPAPKDVQTKAAAPREWLEGPASYRFAVAGIAVLALAIRLVHLFQPMRLDEARSFLDYAIRPLADAISNYNIPNNHLLHTFLVWLTIRVFGHAEWAVRIPALVAGLLIVPATYVATRALADRGAALAAAALSAVLPCLVLYSTNARGYSMVCLAFVALLPVANALADRETTGRWIAFGALIALGAATIPVMLYPAGAVTLWLVAERVRRGGLSGLVPFGLRLGLVLAVAGALAAVVYAPAIARYGVGSIAGNKFVTPNTWPQFVSTLPQFALRLRETIGLGIPTLLLLLLALVGVYPMLARAEGRGRLLTLALATAVWCVVLLVATRRAPPPRVWLFMAPLCCLYVGIGLSRLVGRLAVRARVSAPPYLAAAALLLSAGIGAGAVVRRTVFDNNESASLVAGPHIARWLLAEARPGDRVMVSNMVSPEVDYYLFRLAGRRFADLEAPSRASRVLVILNHREDQTPATVRTERPDLDWNLFETPAPLQQFETASIWVAPRRTVSVASRP